VLIKHADTEARVSDSVRWGDAHEA